jgi:hypothetical protein
MHSQGEYAVRQNTQPGRYTVRLGTQSTEYIVRQSTQPGRVRSQAEKKVRLNCSVSQYTQ